MRCCEVGKLVLVIDGLLLMDGWPMDRSMIANDDRLLPMMVDDEF